jgi:hypothetical protein
LRRHHANDGRNRGALDAAERKHDEQALYRDASAGMGSYVFKIPNGTYRVHLKFAEIEKSTIGQRIFGIELLGETVVERLGIFAQRLRLDSQDVLVSDGLLRLEFVRISMSRSSRQFRSAGISQAVRCGTVSWPT